MGKKPDQRIFTIRAMPWRDSLLTAGQQTTIAETGMWQAINATADLDGMIMKRPGLRKWAQTLKEPVARAVVDPDVAFTAFTDFLNGINDYNEADSSFGAITTSTNQGLLQTNVVSDADTNKTYTLEYNATLPLTNEWSFRFMFRGTNLSAYVPAATVANTFSFQVQSASGTGKTFAIWSAVLQVNGPVCPATGLRPSGG